MKKRLLRILAILLCISLVLPGCAPKENKKEYKDYEKTEYLNDDGAAISAVKVGYDAELGENAEVLNAAAEVMVFESGTPIAITLTALSDSDGQKSYTVTDYYGNTVYSGTVESRSGKTVFTKGIASHPTGYFVVSFEDNSLPYVVTPPISERSEDSFFAARLHINTSNVGSSELAGIRNFASAAKLMGASWVRDGVSWAEYEKNKGEYDFTCTEQAYRLIDGLGLKLLVALESPAPGWTVGEDYPSTEGYNAGLRDTHRDVYNTAKAMASFYNGIVDAWEILPNSDNKHVAAETAAMYASWYKSAVLGIADSGSTALKMFGAFSNSSGTYDRLAIQSGVLAYSDVYNFNAGSAYTGRILDLTENAPLNYHTALSSLWNREKLPLWNTASVVSFSTDMTKAEVGSEESNYQVAYGVTSAVQMLASGVDKIFVATLGIDGSNGFYSAEGLPYPSVAAEAVMTYMLDGADYIGKLSGIPGKGHGYVFEGSRGKVSVVWTNRDKEYTFASDTAVTVTDVMGSSRTVEPVDGKISVNIGSEPLYITYSAEPEYLAQSLPKSEVRNKTEFSVGERVVMTALFDFPKMDPVTSDGLIVTTEQRELTVRVTNYNSVAVSGSISGSLEGFEVSGCENLTVEPMGEATVKLTIKDLGGGTDGFLTVKGVFNGEEITASAWHVYTPIHSRGYLLSVISGVEDGSDYSLSERPEVSARLFNVTTGKDTDLADIPVTAILNGERVDCTVEGDRVSIDISSLEKGAYELLVSFETYGEDVWSTARFTLGD